MHRKLDRMNESARFAMLSLCEGTESVFTRWVKALGWAAGEETGRAGVGSMIARRIQVVGMDSTSVQSWSWWEGKSGNGGRTAWVGLYICFVG